MPTPLETELKTRIRVNGPLTVANYMEACLYHPQHGYYTRGLNFTTTPPRDFLTAPDHTPLFGYTLANWVARQWQALGSPMPFTLAEAGPGRGTLMLHVLTHLQTAHPQCFAAAKPTLVETSPTLIAVQKQTLNAYPHTHHASVTELASPAILLANELLDAYPTHQYTLENDKWFENVITLNESDDFTIQRRPLSLAPALPGGAAASCEYSPGQHAFLAELKRLSITALLVDYGDAQTAPDTLQALHRHQKVNPFHLPGETDLTTHVNFKAAMETLGPAHCTLTDLAPFLLQNGLPALGLQHTAEQPALQRLLHPAGMGTLFKVLCYMPSTR